MKSTALKDALSSNDTLSDNLLEDFKNNSLQEDEDEDEIEDLKQYMLTDEYAEQAAREKLGLVKENEIIFQEEK